MHTDGYITFGSTLPLSSQSDPLVFRLSSATDPTIAPTSSVLSVRDQILASTLVHYRVAEDEATLTIVDRMIEGFNDNLIEFQPVSAIVTTWQLTRTIQNLVSIICAVCGCRVEIYSVFTGYGGAVSNSNRW